MCVLLQSPAHWDTLALQDVGIPYGIALVHRKPYIET